MTGSRRYDSAAESYFYWPPGRRGRGSVVLTRSTPRRAGPKGPPGHESDGTSRLTRMPGPCLCSLAARRRRHAGGRHTEVVGAGGANLNDYFCRRPGHTILGGQKLWLRDFTPAPCGIASGKDIPLIILTRSLSAAGRCINAVSSDLSLVSPFMAMVLNDICCLKIYISS